MNEDACFLSKYVSHVIILCMCMILGCTQDWACEFKSSWMDGRISWEKPRRPSFEGKESSDESVQTMHG